MTHPTTITAAPGLPFVDIVREFDAPVAAVFRAHTEPELFARWTGPRGQVIEIGEFDATMGGRWQYTTRAREGGQVYGFRGVFHTVESDALIIQTFEFDGAPGLVAIGTMTFAAVGRRTRISGREVHPSVEARDAAVASGMEYGVNEGYERLDELLAN